MGRVFIPQIPTRIRMDHSTGKPVMKDGKPVRDPFDMSVASAFGELQEPIFPPWGVPLAPVQYMATIRKNLSDYSDDDSICAVGDPAATAVMAAVAAAVNRGRFAILRWDGRTKQYVRLNFDIHR